MNSSPSTAAPEKSRGFLYAALLTGAALIRFVNLGFLDLQAWDEALYAVRAQAIHFAGVWIDQTPLSIDGLYSSLHPPLYVWGTALAYELFGVSEFSVRFISALSGGLIVFVIYYLGTYIRSKESGMYAALLFSLTPFTVFYSRQGQFDTLLVFLLALSALAIVKSMDHTSLTLPLLAGLALGLALMTKLFVGWGIPIAYAIFILVTRPENRRDHWRNLGVICLAAAALAGPWHIYMTIKHGNGNPLFFVESSELVQRALVGIEGNVKPLEVFYYVNQLVVLFPLGIAFFIHGAWESYRSRNRAPMFLIFWFLFFFLVFSLMRTKLSVYLLPMLVPASLLAGSSMDAMTQSDIDLKHARWIIPATILSFLWSISQSFRNSVRGAISSLVSLEFPHRADAVGSLILIALLIGGGVVSWMFLRSRTVPAVRHFPSVLLLVLLGLSAASVIVFDRHQYVDGASAMAEYIKRSGIRQIVVAGYERNPQLTYYLDGADIGWRDDLLVRRIIPPTDTTLYRSWIQKEISGEHPGTLLLIEKDKFIRYRTIDPTIFLSDGFIRVFESRRYAGFMAGQVDFLASMKIHRNQ